jgi:transposase
VPCGESLQESRMRESCTSGLTRGEALTLPYSTANRSRCPIQARVRELVERGASCEQTKTRRTCANLLKHEVSLWTFVREEGVEPTNNNAERPLRRAVMWRRKSFGTQSESGSRFVERILTVVTSLRQQGRDVLKYLTSACASLMGESGSICLIPDSG